MEWIKAPWDSWPFFIGWTTLIVAATSWVARSGLKAVRWISKEDQMRTTLRTIQPQLDQMARQFPQNGGSSLIDEVIGLARRMERLEEGQQEMINMFRVHIEQRQSGGKRSYDPE